MVYFIVENMMRNLKNWWDMSWENSLLWEIHFIRRNLNRSLAWVEMKQHIHDLQEQVSDWDLKFLLETLSLRTQCIADGSAFEVGAILKLAHGKIYSWFSRQTWPKEHAEEEVFHQAIDEGEDVTGAILYSSLEPCFPRASKKLCCAQLVTQYKLSKVFIADREDTTFVEKCLGTSHIETHWIPVVYYPIAHWIHSQNKPKLKK